MMNTEHESWQELETDIGNLKSLLLTHEVEILGADGYVPVVEFVDKGEWDEYEVTCGDKTVYCNKDHLFETSIGWMLTSELAHFCDRGQYLHILTDDGSYKQIDHVRSTGNVVPIVDIQIDHPNHRYYANGLSSHNTNVGKSLFLCHHAASVLKQGFNALYITLEMAEERIAERIDCNLLDMELDDLHRLSKEDYIEKINSLEHKTNGKLVIKEYPTGGAHVGHFRALLEELKTKKGFTPDVIYVDYLNICASQKYKAGSSYNSYFAVKAIAEELRGLAVEYNVSMITATQSTRAGVVENDLEMTDVSESFGTAATMDALFAIIRTEELDQMGKLMIKQLKSRFNDVGYYKKFVIGIDIRKFKLYNDDSPTQHLSDPGQTDDKPKFDKSKFGHSVKQRKLNPTVDLDFS